MKNALFSIVLLLVATVAFGQKNDKDIRYFDEPIVTDSLSTLMIPIRYNASFFSSNKLAYWHDYYANVLFYNFKSNITKKLFQEETFIKIPTHNSNKFYAERNTKKLSTDKWIFFFVKNIDSDKNGKINNDDPTILYVSDKQGNDLKPITPDNESVISLDTFEKQGFILVKMQRDLTKNNKFEDDDKDFYFLRFDLTTLKAVDKIEIKQ